MCLRLRERWHLLPHVCGDASASVFSNKDLCNRNFIRMFAQNLNTDQNGNKTNNQNG